MHADTHIQTLEQNLNLYLVVPRTPPTWYVYKFDPVFQGNKETSYVCKMKFICFDNHYYNSIYNYYDSLYTF